MTRAIDQTEVTGHREAGLDGREASQSVDGGYNVLRLRRWRNERKEALTGGRERLTDGSGARVALPGPRKDHCVRSAGGVAPKGRTLTTNAMLAYKAVPRRPGHRLPQDPSGKAAGVRSANADAPTPRPAAEDLPSRGRPGTGFDRLCLLRLTRAAPD